MKVVNYSTDDSVIRLTRYQKKGLLRLIFSRLGGIILLLTLQVMMLFSLFTWFSTYIPYYSSVKVAFTVVMIIYLFNSDMDSSAKLTWMFIISMFTFSGAIFLAFTQIEIGHIAMKKRMMRIMRDTSNSIPQDKSVLKDLGWDESGLREMSKYLSTTGDFPIYKNTEVTYFSCGEEKFEALIPELEKAEHFIFLEYFIITEGYMWGRILKILTEKVKQGVEVRVLYDGMCEMSQLPHNYAERLQTFGIKAKTFSKIHPFVSTYYNYRDHRKVLVIDGKVAFNGGVNLADEYINKIERFGHWKDSAVMVKGDAVKAYTLMFLQMWAEDSGVVELGDYLEAGGQSVPKLEKDRVPMLEAKELERMDMKAGLKEAEKALVKASVKNEIHDAGDVEVKGSEKESDKELSEKETEVSFEESDGEGFARRFDEAEETSKGRTEEAEGIVEEHSLESDKASIQNKENDEVIHPSGFVMPYSDIPLDGEKVGETIYMDVLSRAHSYVHIMTPYLVLDDELRTAMKYAAKRGVEISIILPGIPDKRMAYALAKSHYKGLLKSGVNIYEYEPGFVHTKNFVSDDIKAIVGTINLDYRSLYHHFECATFMYKTDCIADVERDFQETLKKCRKVTTDTIRHEKLYYKVMGPLVKLIAPLM